MGAVSIMPGELKELGGCSSQHNPSRGSEGKVFELDTMDEMHLWEGLVPDPKHLPYKFQVVHLCEQFVDIATYPHTVKYAVNDAAEQNSQLTHALESLGLAKTGQNLGGAPADHQWMNPKQTMVLSITHQETLSACLKELCES